MPSSPPKALEAASREISQGVDVVVENGVARLFGTVGSSKDRSAAEKIAASTAAAYRRLEPAAFLLPSRRGRPLARRAGGRGHHQRPAAFVLLALNQALAQWLGAADDRVGIEDSIGKILGGSPPVRRWSSLPDLHPNPGEAARKNRDAPATPLAATLRLRALMGP